MKFRVFVRNWWKENPAWLNGLEPEGAGIKRYIAKCDTEDEARAICRKHNETHDPGRYSRKAEYESSES